MSGDVDDCTRGRDIFSKFVDSLSSEDARLVWIYLDETPDVVTPDAVDSVFRMMTDAYPSVEGTAKAEEWTG